MGIKYKQLFIASLSALLVALSLNAAPPLNHTAYADACTPDQIAQGMETKTDDTQDPPQQNCVAKDNPSDDESSQDDTTTCAIEKLGWVLCPLIETSGKIGDQAFSILANNFLQTEPELVANTSGTKIAWEMARNLANIMFIVVFLIVIFAQLTGYGMSNYGIKKLLPRLIIGAILVNLSYYVCQLIVDLSNIIGFEVKQLLVDAAHQVTTTTVFPDQTSIDTQTSNGNLSKAFVGTGTLALLATGILAGTAVVYFLLPTLIAGIFTVLVTCLIIVIVLLMRKAIIVMLVVASPIAFVAYLLPNTEKFFQKWLRMFWGLLMVFPVVAMLFGAGQLASAVVLVAGTQSHEGTYLDPQTKNGGKCIQLPTTTNTTGGRVAHCTEGSTPFMLGLVAAGIAVAPMLAVWSVLKGALSAAGTLGGKISGAVQSSGKMSGLGKGLGDKLQKRRNATTASRWQSMQARGINKDGMPTSWAGRHSANRAARERRLSASKEDLESAQTRAVNQILGGKNAAAITSGLSDEGAARAVRSAKAAQDKHMLEEMQAASLTARDQSETTLHASIDKFEAGELDVNSPELAAAIDELGKRQDFAQLERVMNRIAGSGPSLANRTLGQALSQNGGGMFTGGQVAQIAQGSYSGGSYMETLNKNLADGIAPEKLAAFNGSLSDEVSRAVTTGAQSQDANLRSMAQQAAASMSQSAGKLVADDILNKKVSGAVLKRMENFENGKFTT